MLHWIIFILLIVSSPSRNFYCCTGCFQSLNIACRNTQNAARKYHSLLKITHNKTIKSFIDKGKYNLNITNSLSCWSVNGNSIKSHCKFRAWQNWEPVQLAEKVILGIFYVFTNKASNYYPAYHIGPDFNWKVPAVWNSLH